MCIKRTEKKRLTRLTAVGRLAGGRLRLRHGGPVLAASAVCVGGMGAALLPGISAPTAYWAVMAMSFLVMALASLFSIQLCAAIQQLAPAHLVGKIVATALAGANFAPPLGQAAYGLPCERWAQLPWAVPLGAVSLAAAAYSGRGRSMEDALQ